MAIVVPFTTAAFSSLFHDFELANYSVVGKLTQTLCQSSLLSRLPPNPAKFSNPTNLLFPSLYSYSSAFARMRRGHNRCLVLVIGGSVLCLLEEDIQMRRLPNESITKADGIDRRVQ
jgi:hypothetical protein